MSFGEPRALLGTHQILNLLYAMGTPQYGKAMGRLWGGHGEAMERLREAMYVAMEAMGNYLCIRLGYKLAMGWLWPGYGLAMESLWGAYGMIPKKFWIVKLKIRSLRSYFAPKIVSLSYPSSYPSSYPWRIPGVSLSYPSSYRSLFVVIYDKS